MKFSMRLFTHRGIYYVEINGKRRSLRTRDKTIARRFYNQIKREYLAGKIHELTGRCTVNVGRYRDEFLEWAENVQPKNTFRANRLALSKLIHYAGEKITLDRISKKHLDAMVAEAMIAGLSIASINNYIRHARTSLNKAVEWGYISRNPLAGAKELPREKKPAAFLDQKAAVRFLKSIKDMDLRRIATALIATGRRRSELLALEWKDVNLKAGQYLIRKSKNHLSRWYPINKMFRTVLVAIGTGEGRVFHRWSHPDTVSKKIKKALNDAGRRHLTLHSLRHTFASLQVMQGRDLKTIQELLGHSEIKTTQIYTHLTQTHLARAAEIHLGPVDLGD
jgi:integrase